MSKVDYQNKVLPLKVRWFIRKMSLNYPEILRALRSTDLKLLTHTNFNIKTTSQQLYIECGRLKTFNAKRVYYI